MQSLRPPFYLIAVLSTCAGLLVATGARPATAAADTASSRAVHALAAVYGHSGGDADRAARDAAIDYTINPMNIVVRAIARGKLKETNLIFKSVAIDVRGTAVTVAFDARSYAGTLGGPPTEVIGINGDKLSLTYRARGEELVQSFVGKRGGRTNVFRRRGARLVIGTTVFSSKLPRRLEYELNYVAR